MTIRPESSIFHLAGHPTVLPRRRDVFESWPALVVVAHGLSLRQHDNKILGPCGAVRGLVHRNAGTCLMTIDRTQRQSTEEQHQARKRSQARTRPPLDLPGYEARQFLGAGAYGEVWVAIDQNTGRRVAIKFYTHHRGLDVSLLAQEVEKLVFLSADRYVVQLLDVGWTADPPYYVMEYIENGSLEDHLQRHGPLPVGAAVEMFREVATGLLRSHSRGVLHCDLKPANVLLDQDHHPRLADFGQSRLSCEQTPALGTLFFMAPEQADLDAVPDARWDVYALGALLHCMLTGEPPHRSSQAVSQIDSTPDLEQRLHRYRELIRRSPPPELHKQHRGIDRALSEILQRCLAIDPEARYPTVQSVLDGLRARDRQRDRRPLVILGLLGPLLFLLVTALFAYSSYLHTVDRSDELLLSRRGRAMDFAADFVAEAVARRIEGYFRSVEEVAGQAELKAQITRLMQDDQLAPLLRELARDDLPPEQATCSCVRRVPTASGPADHRTTDRTSFAVDGSSGDCQLVRDERRRSALGSRIRHARRGVSGGREFLVSDLFSRWQDG